MYYIVKKIEVSAAHRLSLSYESKCSSIHGHNWILTIHCRAKELNADGMVCDFTKIKEHIQSRLDHTFLNDVLPFNPTAENIARWVCDEVENCYKVEVEESEGNIAIYEKD
ncbi:MAG: 6-carboxytetrahydropterin synthase QueD [Bacteroidales bacterium]|nr:6-carboxytetrahydropterin synthase QueD [Bacteroidales bacterium]